MSFVCDIRESRVNDNEDVALCDVDDPPLALCEDVHSCDKQRFIELSEDEAHKAFRKSVVDACGEEYRVNGWRKRVRRASRDVTCAILLDDFFLC